MLIAAVGCVHGEMKRVYASISALEKKLSKKVDLVLFTGDLQTARNKKDLESMAVPPKYKKMGDFHDYFNNNLKIPRLTIAIGGNHECSEYLMEYPNGGFLIPNFYYMGYSSIVKAKGITIAGWSGIYKDHNFNNPRDESIPLNDNTMRSIYHTRKIDYDRLNEYEGPVDIGMSHDWPGNVAYFANTQKIFKDRPWFKQDIENQELGNPYALKLMRKWNPKYWISSHMHYKFSCQVGKNDPLPSNTKFKDPNSVKQPNFTTFIALDKPKGNRLDYLELFEIPNQTYSKLIEQLL